MPDTTLTVAIMDAPYEAATSTTAFRIIAAALEKGVNVNVFAYEGAVSLSVKEQAPHANPVKGTSVEEEAHPTTKDLVAALLQLGTGQPRLAWVNCGLCVDELPLRTPSTPFWTRNSTTSCPLPARSLARS